MMFYFVFTIVVFLVAFALYFLRVPTREIGERTAVLSPANGKVIAIDRIDTSHLTFFKEGIQNELEVQGVTLPAHVVVIQMNLKDVHVQRAPISGTVVYIEHFKGKFKNALYSKQKTHLVNTNEKNLTIIKSDREVVGVIQVAGQLARRIKSYVKVGDVVTEGQKIGFISFGSQVVLVLPAVRILQVGIGDITVDGETVIAR